MAGARAPSRYLVIAVIFLSPSSFFFLSLSRGASQARSVNECPLIFHREERRFLSALFCLLVVLFACLYVRKVSAKSISSIAVIFRPKRAAKNDEPLLAHGILSP